MNKSGFAVALVALVVVLCAAGASARKNEHSGWYCGQTRGETRFKTDAPLEWTNKNDKICKGVCKKELKGIYPVYKKGNYALFTDGLYCCCSVRHLFTANRYPYGESSPHISPKMAEKLKLTNPRSPTD